LKSGNACYHSGQNLLSFSLLPKNTKIMIYRTIILPVVLNGCEIWSLTLRKERRLRVFENRVLRRIHGLSGKFPNVQNSPPLRRPSGVRQVLLSSNEFDELRRENRIALTCLVIVLCFFM
jgi:hypothetical protein